MMVMSRTTRISPDIEFPEAYERAVRNKIIGGAQKKFLATFERAQEVYNFLRGFEDVKKESFLTSMYQALFVNYGKLTEKQYLAVVKVIDAGKERKAAFMKAVEEQKAKSEFLGVESEKAVLRLTVDSVIMMNAVKFSYYDSSVQFLFLMHDDQGNRVIYRSKSYLTYKFKETFVGEKRVQCSDEIEIKAGMAIYVNATIKAHTEYKGEKQTIIQRPKVTGLEYSDEMLKDLVNKCD